MAGRNWWLKNNYDVFYTIDMFRLLNSVETVCLLYHQKDKFISVPYEPKDAEYLKTIPGNATYDEMGQGTVLCPAFSCGTVCGTGDGSSPHLTRHT